MGAWNADPRVGGDLDAWPPQLDWVLDLGVRPAVGVEVAEGLVDGELTFVAGAAQPNSLVTLPEGTAYPNAEKVLEDVRPALAGYLDGRWRVLRVAPATWTGRRRHRWSRCWAEEPDWLLIGFGPAATAADVADLIEAFYERDDAWHCFALGPDCGPHVAAAAAGCPGEPDEWEPLPDAGFSPPDTRLWDWLTPGVRGHYLFDLSNPLTYALRVVSVRGIDPAALGCADDQRATIVPR